MEIRAKARRLVVLLSTATVFGQSFVHTECFNNVGEPSGAVVPGGYRAALIEGFQVSAQYINPGPITLSSTETDIPTECFSTTDDSGSQALDIDGRGQVKLNSCASGRSTTDLLIICLTVCTRVSGCGGALLHKAGDKNECQLHTSVNLNAPLCAEFPLKYSCTTRTANHELLGLICPTAPMRIEKYRDASRAIPPPGAPPRSWDISFAIELDFSSTSLTVAACADISGSVANAAFAALPLLTNSTVECPDVSNLQTAGGLRFVVTVVLSDGAEDAVYMAIDDAACGYTWGATCSASNAGSLANQIATQLVTFVPALVNAPLVTVMSPSSWTLEEYRTGLTTELTRCVGTNGEMLGQPITAEQSAVIIAHNTEYGPEQHAPPPLFFRSQRDPADLFPIPDGCFANTADGSPSNPALIRRSAHIELLGPDCVGNRTQEEMVRICLTICSHIDFSDSPEGVDSRCVGVNYDEHGEVNKGHCHLASPTRLQRIDSPTCVANGGATGSVNIAGVCGAHPTPTSRAQCSSGQIFGGTANCGQYNYVGLFCSFTSDVGPTEGRWCAYGTGFNNETDSCNTCLAGTFSALHLDSRLDRNIPRPRDFPSAFYQCDVCPPGRYCGGNKGCTWHSDPATCPDRCPLGHQCPMGSTTPTACRSMEYQDQTGNETCKTCPTNFGLAEGAVDIADCLCPNDYFRNRLTSVHDPTNTDPCIPCIDGMNCDWTSSTYINPSSPQTRAEQIRNQTVFQTVPFILPGYWADSSAVRTVMLCDGKRIHPDCIGGDPRQGQLCGAGRQGPLCSQCSSDQQIVEEGGCEACDGGGDAVRWIGFFVLMIAVMYAFHRVTNRPETQERLSSLTSAAALGLVLEVAQLFAAFAKLKCDFSQPFSFVIDMILVIGMADFSVVHVACVLGSGALVNLIIKLTLPIILCTLFCVIFFIDTKLRPAANLSVASLQNTVGTIFLTLYTSLSLATFKPLLCFRQEDGTMSSVDHPEVECWNSPTHQSMVAVSSLFIIVYPVGILVLCFYAIWRYPQHVITDPKFARRYKCLFVRWKTERYFYPILRLLRNLFVAAVPTLLPYDEPEALTTLLIFIITIALMMQLMMLPWRSDGLNLIDAVTMLMMITFLSVVGTSLGNGGLSSTQSTLVTLIVSLQFVAIILYALYQLSKTYEKNTYKFFLSHHKSGAGNTARLIKLLLEKAGGTAGDKIFYDADNLQSLDSLFDAVRATDTIVVLLSGETTSRPWCVGEIAVAHANGVKIVPVNLPGSQRVASEDITKHFQRQRGSSQNLKLQMVEETVLKESNESAGVSDEIMETLTPFGITEDDVSAAFSELGASPRYSCKGAIDVVKALGLDDGRIDKVMKSSALMHTEADAKYAVIGDGSNIEASSVTLYFKITLQTTTGEIVSGGPAIKHEKIIKQNLKAFHHVSGLVVVLTQGCLQSPEFLTILALAHRAVQDSCTIQPIVADKSFQFPDADFFANMEATGAPLAQSTEAFEAMLAFCWDGGTNQRITANEASAMIQKTLRRIAVPFDINYSSELAIAQETQTVISRLQPKSLRKESSKAAESMLKGTSGSVVV